MNPLSPQLSVVVPVHNAEAVLDVTLQGLMQSDLERSQWELIVVDDASSDGSAAVAARFADRMVTGAERPGGPAFARNLGCVEARGEVLVFVDSDVRVAPEALSRIAEHFRKDASIAAVFGAYDDQPPAPGVVSRYRNLLHHYHHLRGAGDAETFWAGLGAVRTSVFRKVGGFDAVRYARPQIEDIELGRRIRRAGHRILLDPTIRGTHLKHWDLIQVFRTDLLHRGIPWMRLILAEGGGGQTLNVKPREKVCVALVGLALALLSGAVILGSALMALLGVVAIAVVIRLNLELYRYLAPGRGAWFALALVPLHLSYYVTSGVAFVGGHLAHRLSRVRRSGSWPG